LCSATACRCATDLSALGHVILGNVTALAWVCPVDCVPHHPLEQRASYWWAWAVPASYWWAWAVPASYWWAWAVPASYWWAWAVPDHPLDERAWAVPFHPLDEWASDERASEERASEERAWAAPDRPDNRVWSRQRMTRRSIQADLVFRVELLLRQIISTAPRLSRRGSRHSFVEDRNASSTPGRTKMIS